MSGHTDHIPVPDPDPETAPGVIRAQGVHDTNVLDPAHAAQQIRMTSSETTARRQTMAMRLLSELPTHSRFYIV